MEAESPAQASSRSAWRDVLAVARRTPATIAITVTVLIAGATTGALWTSAEESGLVERWGWGVDAFREGRVWTILGGLVIAPTPWMYGLILVVFLAGAGYLEYRFGTWRMLVVTIGTHVAAVAATAVLFLALGPLDLPWVTELSHVADVGLSNAGFGAVGAVTATMPALWRRRTRLVGVLYTLAMILWAGEIWDFTHMFAFLAGLAVGPWVAGRGYERVSWRAGAQEIRDLAAIVLAFGSIHSLLTTVWPGQGGILDFGHPATDDTTLLGQIGLSIINLTFAFALHKGSRFAWWFVVVVSSIAAFGGTIEIAFESPGASAVLDVVLDVILLVVLIRGRRHFRVKGERGGRARIWRRIGIAAFATVAFTTLAILALGDSFDHKPSVAEAIGASVLRIFGVSAETLQPTTGGAKFLLGAIGIAWYVIIAVSVAALLLTSRRHEPAEDARERFIALQTSGTGMSSIGYMARWEGITHWVSDGGDAAWGFKLVANTAVVLGDPAGGADAVDATVDEFTDFCKSRGWRPAYFAVTPGMRTVLDRHGFRSIQVAEDTVIHLPELAFTGKAWQDVRSAINRAGREGVTMRSIHLHEAPRGLKDQLEAISAQWVGDKSLPEMGFTLGDLPEAADPNVVMHLAVDADGTVHGMTSWLPVYRDGDVVGWTIDIMKRRLDDGVMSGVMEFLIAQSALTFKEEGYEFISLSCAPLSYSGDVESSVERLLDVLADKMEPYYGFTSLERFKAKFKPEHVPMYLAYEDEAQLPAFTLAILRAYLPDAGPADLVRAAVSRPD